MSTASEELRLAWLALTLTPRMAVKRIQRAAELLGNVERIFTASLTELESVGFPAESAQFVFSGRARQAAEVEAATTLALGAGFLCPQDEAYPAPLLHIFDPPTILWYRGTLTALAREGIAVVGTRHPTPYGTGMAQSLSRELALRGLAIFSGMARGIDTAAHKGALEAGGTTVAVWGTGIDVIYPKENKRLAEDIVASGGVILTEFSTGTFPAVQNFPIRNRTLSGMSVGVLVVEGAEHSGTRITARCALEQGRDVYAVPGNATNKNAWGPNTLIKQGAKLAGTWQDVWEDLPTQLREHLEDDLAAASNESSTPTTASLFNVGAPNGTANPAMSDHERLVFATLKQDEAIQLDDLIDRLETKLVSAEIFTALFELELAGRIRQMPGKNYLRTF